MKKKNIALLLSGGYGSRLYPLTYFIPKIFLYFKRKTLLEHHLDSLNNLNINKVYINLLRKNNYYYFLKNFSKNNKIKFIFEKKPIGSSRTVSKIIKKENFNNLIILYSDTFFFNEQSDILNKLLKISKNKFVSMVISKSENTKYLLSKGIVKIKKNKLISFHEKPKKIDSSYGYFFSGIVIIPKISKKQILKILIDKIDKYKIIDFAEKVFSPNKINVRICISRRIPLDFGNWKNLLKNYFRI